MPSTFVLIDDKFQSVKVLMGEGEGKGKRRDKPGQRRAGWYHHYAYGPWAAGTSELPARVLSSRINGASDETTSSRRRCSSPSSPMAKMFSDLQGSVRLLLHLRSKEIRKSDGCVWRLGRNGNWSYDTAEVRTRKSKVAATVTFTESIWRWRMITFSRIPKKQTKLSVNAKRDSPECRMRNTLPKWWSRPAHSQNRGRVYPNEYHGSS